MAEKNKSEVPARAPNKFAAPAYLVKFDGAPDLMGITKAVDFIHGHGVLDRVAIGTANADYINAKTGELTPDGLTTLKVLADFWAKRGAKMEEVSEEKAAAYRALLDKNPRGHLPKEEAPKEKKAETTAKPKAGDAQAPPHKETKKE